jgi:tetratricopeptide (TPR) repeat protein
MRTGIDQIRKDDKKAEDFYLKLTAVQTELEREDALLKDQSNQYPLYGMDRKLEAVQSSRMLVIPYREYIKLYPESEIDAHKTDENYLSKRSEEMSARWPKEALTKKVETYYANIGATYIKFRTLGMRAQEQKNYSDALKNYQRALELAENDNQRAEGTYFIAVAQYMNKQYGASWNSINKAIDINSGDMRFYNIKYNILIGLTSTTGGQYQRLDINVLITNAIQTLTKAKSACESEGQEREFERCDNNLAEARKTGHRYAIERAQLFMKGLSFGQMYQMQSGDVKLSAPLTEY